jgi:hypothetical protein
MSPKSDAGNYGPMPVAIKQKDGAPGGKKKPADPAHDNFFPGSADARLFKQEKPSARSQGHFQRSLSDCGCKYFAARKSFFSRHILRDARKKLFFPRCFAAYALAR